MGRRIVSSRPILERARRLSGGGAPTRLLDDLRGVATTETLARIHGLPRATIDGVRTFYDALHGDPGPRSCSGTACTFAESAQSGSPSVRCLGRCYAPPARSDEDAPPIPRSSLVDPPVVLRHLLPGTGLVRDDGYASLPGGDAILEAVESSGLRGRGGAAYPTGAKWRVARETPATDRFVVANGDEGDPGAYSDRLLLEEDPHAVLTGMLACARAIGARRGILFLRGEYERAHGCVEAAAAEARAEGFLGPGFDVTVLRGAGSYVAGEETALLRAIEGLRAEPSPKPPYPAERGLFGLPTIVQNVETLAVVPWVVRHRRRSDTKVVSVSGAVARPGAVEIRFGTTLRQLLHAACGGPPPDRPWKMALVGGPMGRVLPESAFDQALSYEALPGLGHGGIVVLDARVSARRLAEHLFEFAASESCGTCAPCRIGCARLAGARSRMDLERLLATLEIGSLCGFGLGVPRPIRDLLAHFSSEVLPREMFPC